MGSDLILVAGSTHPPEEEILLGAFARLREKMDVRKSNGGVFLGLNGIVVKSHGGTDEEGFAAAIELGYDMIRNKLLERIKADLDTFHSRQPALAAGAAKPAETMRDAAS